MSLVLDERQRAMLGTMGIRTWRAAAASPVAEPAPPTTPITPPARVASSSAQVDPRTASLSWVELQQAVAGCQACGLCKHRKTTVFGTGGPASDERLAPKVDWLLVGEAPGEQEDLAGEPFVGQAGKLLDNMLACLGLSRHKADGGGLYIANTLKCRPPANRNPSPEETLLCAPWLARQIELLQPRIIVAMGRFAAQSLLRDTVSDIDKVPLGKLRGQVHRYQSLPVVVTYHPAYLLRNLPDKAKAWEDWVLARELVQKS